jgi:hypothetical protein
MTTPSPNISTGRSLQDNKASFLRVLENAARRVDWLTFDMDPLTTDDTAVIDQMSRLARSHESSCVRILLVQPERLQGKRHRLLLLMQQLGSKIQMRTATEQQKRELVSCFAVCDKSMWYRRPIATQWEFEAGDAPTISRVLLGEFDDLWQHADQHHPFRRLEI